MKKLTWLIALVAILTTSSCGEYQKVLKSKDNQFKYTKAKEYYENKKYSKAKVILTDLINVYRGTDKAEEIYYLYTYCHYNEGDYILGGYYFKNFSETYRNSEYTEECTYMTAYCNYLDSPTPQLDQEATREALKNFDLFLSKYPNTKRKDNVEKLQKELYTKLNKKRFLSVQQYYDLRAYNSVVVSVSAALKSDPNTIFKEDLLLLDVKAKYDYALNSIEEKQKERFEGTVKAYYTFVDAFPESEYFKEVERIFNRAKKSIDELKSKSATKAVVVKK